MFGWSRSTDLEYVARIRRSVELWDRYRVALVGLSVALLGAAVWILPKGIQLLIGLIGGNAGPRLVGFATGAFLGLAAGHILHSTVNLLIMGLAGFRTERLLLQYYDEDHGYDPEPVESSAEPSNSYQV